MARGPDEPKKRERYAVSTYSHNPPGLMEFFDDPKNWGEDHVKSGISIDTLVRRWMPGSLN